MKTILPQPRCFEFAFPRLATHVRVEDHGSSVDIVATRDTFSEQRKVAFVRELVAEGFIDQSFLRFPPGHCAFGPGVRWQVDFSWLESPATPNGRARLRKKLLLLASGFLLWAGFLAGLFICAGR